MNVNKKTLSGLIKGQKVLGVKENPNGKIIEMLFENGVLIIDAENYYDEPYLHINFVSTEGFE